MDEPPGLQPRRDHHAHPSPPGAGGTFSQPGLGLLLGAAPGTTWYAQTWYRDPAGPCGGGFNTSNGLVLTFTP